MHPRLQLQMLEGKIFFYFKMSFLIHIKRFRKYVPIEQHSRNFNQPKSDGQSWFLFGIDDEIKKGIEKLPAEPGIKCKQQVTRVAVSYNVGRIENKFIKEN